MRSSTSREFLLERRLSAPDKSSLWDSLSLGQKFSVDGLSQLHYELIFIRHRNGINLAVLKSHDGLATIDEQGEIDISPNITTRS